LADIDAMSFRIENARVILPDEIATVAVEVSDGLISGIDTADADQVIDLGREPAKKDFADSESRAYFVKYTREEVV
jgi:dihydroorotase-like cyclic amidohydrolase